MHGQDMSYNVEEVQKIFSTFFENSMEIPSLVQRVHCLRKSATFLFLWYLWQILSNFAKSCQKHTTGNWKKKHVYTAQQISLYVFILNFVKKISAYKAPAHSARDTVLL